MPLLSLLQFMTDLDRLYKIFNKKRSKLMDHSKIGYQKGPVFECFRYYDPHCRQIAETEEWSDKIDFTRIRKSSWLLHRRFWPWLWQHPEIGENRHYSGDWIIDLPGIQVMNICLIIECIGQTYWCKYKEDMNNFSI